MDGLLHCPECGWLQLEDTGCWHCYFTETSDEQRTTIEDWAKRYRAIDEAARRAAGPEED